MVKRGQVWESGERAVRVVTSDGSGVVVRDSFGWRRSLTEYELEHGFSLAGDHVERVRGVMARRSLADIDPG